MYQLQNMLNVLVSGIRERHFMLGREPKKVYGLMLKTVLHAVNQARFSEVESNPLLTTITNDVRTLVAFINTLIQRRVAESSIYLKNAIDALECMRNSRKPFHIILCDALSLPEYMFLLYTFHEFVSADKAFCAVNPGGKTATFKYLAKEYLGIKKLPSLEEVTMRKVGEGLREKLGASGSSVFRDIDMFIHYGGEYEDVGNLINNLFKIINKLHSEVENWLNNKYKVLILADHGYDILRNDNIWTLTHRWEKDKLCVSPFVPILIMG